MDFPDDFYESPEKEAHDGMVLPKWGIRQTNRFIDVAVAEINEAEKTTARRLDVSPHELTPMALDISRAICTSALANVLAIVISRSLLLLIHQHGDTQLSKEDQNTLVLGLTQRANRLIADLEVTAVSDLARFIDSPPEDKP